MSFDLIALPPLFPEDEKDLRASESYADLAIKIVDRTTPEASRESVDASIPKPLSGKSESGARQVSDAESKTPSFKPTPSSGQTSAAKPQFSSAKSLTKKALIQHLDSILAHKHRTWFERPVTDKQAPGYSRWIFYGLKDLWFDVKM